MTREEARDIVENRKRLKSSSRLTKLQNRIRELGKEEELKSLGKCNKTPIRNVDTDVVEDRNGKAKVHNMILCDKEVCPVCMEITKKVLEMVLTIAIRWARSKGYIVVMETYKGIVDKNKSNRENVKSFIKSMRKFTARVRHLEEKNGAEFVFRWLEATFNLILSRVDKHSHVLVFMKEEREQEYEATLEKKREMWYEEYTKNVYVPEWKREYFKEHCFYVSRDENGRLKRFEDASYVNKNREEYQGSRSDYTLQMVQLLDLEDKEYTDYYIEYCEAMNGERSYGFPRKLKQILLEEFGIGKKIKGIKGDALKKLKMLYNKVIKGEEPLEDLHIDNMEIEEEMEEEKEDKVILRIHHELWYKEILEKERENYKAREEMLDYITRDKIKGMEDWLIENDIKYKIANVIHHGKEIPMFYSDYPSDNTT